MNKQNVVKMLAAACVTVLMFSGCTDSGSADDSSASSKKKPFKQPQVPASVELKDDFYGYMNVDQLNNWEIPYGDTAVGGFYESYDAVDKKIDKIIDEIIAGGGDYEVGTPEQMIASYYNAVLNDKSDKAAFERIQKDYKEIQAAKDVYELFDIWCRFYQNYQTECVIGLTVDRDIRDNTKNAITIDQNTMLLDSEMKMLYDDNTACQKLDDLVRDMLCIFGEDKNDAKTKADQLISMYLEICAVTDFSIAEQDIIKPPEKLSNDELKALGAEHYLHMLGVDKNPYDYIYVTDKKQFEKISEMFTDEYLEEWKTYATAALAYKCGRYCYGESDLLSTYNVVDEDRKEKDAKEKVKQILVEELAQIYAERYDDKKTDKKAKEMCDFIMAGYKKKIHAADWLSEQTRKNLIKKLNNITVNIGNLNQRKVDKEMGEMFNGTLFEQDMKVNQLLFEREKEYVGGQLKPISNMNTSEINACYIPINNSINIPSAIMQEPFFSFDYNMYENLGKLGSVIAHEIGHAFDSECIQYDYDGKYNPDWISQSDWEKLEKRADRAEDYYDQYTVLDVYHVNGKKTLGENYADIGGVQCIVSMIEDKKDLKVFFENYARLWVEKKIDSDVLDQLEMDVHSPEVIRVNAVLSSIDEFYEVYGIKEGDGMYIAPEKRVKRW